MSAENHDLCVEIVTHPQFDKRVGVIQNPNTGEIRFDFFDLIKHDHIESRTLNTLVRLSLTNKDIPDEIIYQFINLYVVHKTKYIFSNYAVSYHRIGCPEGIKFKTPVQLELQSGSIIAEALKPYQASLIPDCKFDVTIVENAVLIAVKPDSYAETIYASEESIIDHKAWKFIPIQTK